MKKFASRKLFAVVGAGLVGVLAKLGLPEDAAAQLVEWLFGMIMVYVASQGVVDATSEVARTKSVSS